MMPSVEEKEQLFVAEYLKDFNACQAAIRAGYSEKRGRQTGHDLLRKPHIQQGISEAVSRMVTKIERRTGVSVERLLVDIDRVGSAAEIEGKYSDALKAYELLGKHLKMFTDKFELSGDVGLAERLKEARERIK